MKHQSLMLRKLSLMVMALGALAASPQSQTPDTPLTLEQCRTMALQNNKQIAIQKEMVTQAGYMKKEAFSAYLPSLDFTGAYFYNQKKLALFDSDQMLPIKSFDIGKGTYEFNIAKNPLTGEPLKGPDGQYIPSEVAYLPKEAMEFDIHNVFFGAVTLTQPIFMGGKIVAMNKLTKYAEELAAALHDNEAQNTIYSVDAAYWLVVSLEAKHKLAVSYVTLLDSLDNNVGAMLREGVATRSDKLTVDVKLNQAQIDLVKVKNGLTLSKMALAQICGLPIDGNYTLADDLSEVDTDAEIATSYNMNEVYSRRKDVAALNLAVKIANQQKNVAKASMMPNVVLLGAYSFSNPNSFNGFKKNFNGGFSIGVGVTIPIWHWGGNYNKYRAAKSAQTISEITLADAKEKIDLQVSQAAFKAQEALKTYEMTVTNLDKANENLRSAQLGFREGVLTADDVIAAQTAWLQAHSEKIDASIDVNLCDVYLSKVLGTL